jgi:membrane associated rhomboid family serine protease
MKTATEEYKNQTRIEHEWELPDRILDKPAGYDYGYMTDEKATGCSQEELISKVVKRGIADIDLVWTPETPHPVLPEKVPLLISAFKKRAGKEARKAIYWGAGLLIFGLILALAFNDKKLLYRNLFSILGAVALLEGLWQLYSLRNYSLEDVESEASSARFADWIKSRSITGYTAAIASCIILVGLAQVITGEKQSILAVGLVKAEVWRGQWWRLFTCTLMHVNFTHFWMNFLALLEFARIIEQTIQRAYMPLVFLLSALSGSVFSLLLYPNTTSVGASGGLMGLLGFMTMAVYFNHEKYPPKYFRRLIEAIIFVGLLGVVGFAFIDNAAHLGGLLGGLTVGWIFLRRVSKGERGTLRVGLSLMGIISLVLIGLITAAALWHMFS